MEFIQKVVACNTIGYIAIAVVFLNLAIIPLQAGLGISLICVGVSLIATALTYIVLPMSVLVAIGILAISVFTFFFCRQFFVGGREWPRFCLPVSLFAAIIFVIFPGITLGNLIRTEQE